MILGKKLNFESLRHLHSSIEINISELANAKFVWEGRNSYSLNRCFIVLEGDGEIRNHTEPQVLHMSPGNAYFMPQGLDLSFNFKPGLSLYSIHFHAYILPSIDIFSGETKCFEFPVTDYSIEELGSMFTNDTSWKTLCLFEAFLWEMLSSLQIPDYKQLVMFSRLDSKYGNLLKYLHDNINAQTSIDELCTVSDLSRDTLSRNFSRDFGVSLKTFIINKLIAKAERHLSQTDMTVREIAAEMKFSSEFYFSAFFKRVKGVTPSHFRKMLPG